jgi:PilZ domain
VQKQVLTASNRRYAPRFNIKVPLVFCAVDASLERGHEAISINICERGVYFKTEQPVSVGLPVRVLLQMPDECGGKPATPVVFTGRVSHVAAKRRGRPRSGVGIEFLYSEKFGRI